MKRAGEGTDGSPRRYAPRDDNTQGKAEVGLRFRILVAFAVVAAEEFVGGFVTVDALGGAVPLKAAAKFHRDHAEEGHVGREVDIGDIGDRLGAGAAKPTGSGRVLSVF